MILHVHDRVGWEQVGGRETVGGGSHAVDRISGWDDADVEADSKVPNRKLELPRR